MHARIEENVDVFEMMPVKHEGTDREALARFAKELDLNVKLFEQALDRKTHAAGILDSVAVAKAAGITRRPSFLVGGKHFLQGLASYRRFVRLIERVRAEKAKK